MKKLAFLLLSFVWIPYLNGQYYRASLEEDYSLKIERIADDLPFNHSRDNFNQLPGFPKGTLALAINKKCAACLYLFKSRYALIIIS